MPIRLHRHRFLSSCLCWHSCKVGTPFHHWLFHVLTWNSAKLFELPCAFIFDSLQERNYSFCIKARNLQKKKENQKVEDVSVSSQHSCPQFEDSPGPSASFVTQTWAPQAVFIESFHSFVLSVSNASHYCMAMTIGHVLSLFPLYQMQANSHCSYFHSSVK